jgi:hypothetical protein
MQPMRSPDNDFSRKNSTNIDFGAIHSLIENMLARIESKNYATVEQNSLQRIFIFE